MTLSLLFYFTLSSLLLAALPGPSMMLAIQGSLKKGFRKGMEITFGVLLGDVALLIGVIVGVGEVLSQSPNILAIMGTVANGYLIYLGVSSLKTLRHFVKAEESVTNKFNWKTGFFITVINPKTIVFLLAYFPQFLDPKSLWSTTQQMILLAVIFLIAVAVVMFFYAFSAALAKQFLNRPNVQKIMNLTFGVLLIYLGVNGFIQE